jgi:glutamyl-tRNA reductase
MATLAVAHLRERGMDPIQVVGRNLDRATRLAQRFDGRAVPSDRLVHALAGADLVVSCTGATAAVIGPAVVREALPSEDGAHRTLFLLDLAVPRDVDPSVRSLTGATVVDLDDLKALILEAEGGSGGQAAEARRVRDIVAQEVERFEAWRRSARLAPLIQALRDRGERIQAAELARFAPRLSGLSDREREAVEAVARGVIAKLLHGPMVKLKEAAGPGSSDALARALAELFDLPFPGGGPTS